MSRNAMRACLLSGLVALALAACSSDSKKAEPDPNTLPVNYKQEIIDTLTRELDDPTNVRDAFISEPVLRTAGHDQRYTICVRYNARNLSRNYTGIKDRIGYFYGGHLNQLVEATKEQCGNAPYKPFPELEKLCLGTKCE
jgi:ABC-type Fe3+-hydroxamate transport system substrate-binding protein